MASAGRAFLMTPCRRDPFPRKPATDFFVDFSDAFRPEQKSINLFTGCISICSGNTVGTTDEITGAKNSKVLSSALKGLWLRAMANGVARGCVNAAEEKGEGII